METKKQLETTCGVICCESTSNTCKFIFKSDLSHNNPSAKHCIIPDYKALFFLDALKKCFYASAQFQASSHVDNDVVFEETMFVLKPKSLVPLKVMLQVVAYQQQPYIWLRRFWYDRHLLTPSDTTSTTTPPSSDLKYPVPGQDGGSWKPCRFAYRFSTKEDQFHCIEDFIKDQLKQNK